MASAVLERMSPAASSLKASLLIGSPDAGPPALLADAGRQLGFLVSVLVAESDLDRKHHKKN